MEQDLEICFDQEWGTKKKVPNPLFDRILVCHAVMYIMQDVPNTLVQNGVLAPVSDRNNNHP